MAGLDWLNNNHQYKVGDPCWIIVNDVNRPTGRWKGIVTVGNDLGLLGASITAIITDERIPAATIARSSYLNRSPTENYLVLPRNLYIDHFWNLLDKAEADVIAGAVRARTREEAFKEALAVFKKA